MLLSMILDYQYLSSEKRNYAHGRLSSRDHARMIGMVARPLALVARPVVSVGTPQVQVDDSRWRVSPSWSAPPGPL